MAVHLSQRLFQNPAIQSRGIVWQSIWLALAFGVRATKCQPRPCVPVSQRAQWSPPAGRHLHFCGRILQLSTHRFSSGASANQTSMINSASYYNRPPEFGVWQFSRSAGEASRVPRDFRSCQRLPLYIEWKRTLSNSRSGKTVPARRSSFCRRRVAPNSMHTGSPSAVALFLQTVCCRAVNIHSRASGRPGLHGENDWYNLTFSVISAHSPGGQCPTVCWACWKFDEGIGKHSQ